MYNKPKLEVADIFRLYGPHYRSINGTRLPLRYHRTMRAIEICRTSVLGGHIDKCDNCGKEKNSYNSCRNRHCPKCQFIKKEEWLDKRTKDILPVEYFHVVFTIPDDLNPIALRNQKVIYDILFKAASDTLKELALDKKHLGAKIGFICFLHTWGSNLYEHPHLHCIVPGGGLSEDNKTWKSSRKGFFIHYKVLARLFRGKFMHLLKENYDKGKLKFPNNTNEHSSPIMFNNFCRNLYRKEWNVHPKPSFKNSETVFRYLASYTHRIAISNHRLIKIEDDRVYFHYKDYRDKNKNKIMSLKANEFIRRFLLHVLPDRFVKIRYYGLLTNRYRKKNIEICRKLLSVPIEQNETDPEIKETWQEKLFRLTGHDVLKCSHCKIGKMIKIKTILPQNSIRSP